GDGGAMEHHVDGLARDIVLVAKRSQPGDHAARGIVGGRRYLVDAGLARVGVSIDQVGESPANIHADQPHSLLPTLVCAAPFANGSKTRASPLRPAPGLRAADYLAATSVPGCFTVAPSPANNGQWHGEAESVQVRKAVDRVRHAPALRWGGALSLRL